MKSFIHVQPHTYGISANRSGQSRTYIGKTRTPKKKDLLSKTRYLFKFIQLFPKKYDVTKHMIQSGDGGELISLKEVVFTTRKPLLPALPILHRPLNYVTG